MCSGVDRLSRVAHLRTFGGVEGVDRSSPMPLWAQVLDQLRRGLDAGQFSEGFPTDLEITRRCGVSRHTAREAVRRLQVEGLITRERGRGTFVTPPAIEQATGAIYSLYRSVEALGMEQRSVVLDLSVCVDPAAAAQLDLPGSTQLVRLERLRYADDEVLAHDTAWLPSEVADPLLEVDFTRTALYDELQRTCGIRLTSGEERIGTELPGREERRLLGVGARQPVFRIQRLSRVGDRPVEWRQSLVRGDRYSFVAQWSSEEGYEASLAPTARTAVA